MNLQDLLGRTSKLIADNSPQILTAIGIVGSATTAYLAGKASWQAADIIRLKEASDEQRGVVFPDPREMLKERAELVWKLYIPPAVMLTATVAAIVASNRVSAGRMAGIATAYTMLDRNFAEHKDKVIEKLGERKAETIRDEIAQDRINATSDGVDVAKLIGVDKGDICYDMFGGQYFVSSVEEINAAVNAFNATLLSYDTGTLADFYRMLGLEAPAFSETIGWTSNELVKVRIGSTIIHETKPCLTIAFQNDPKPDFGRFR